MRMPSAMRLILMLAALTAALTAAGASDLSVLSLPPGERPVLVRASIDMLDINEVDDGTETFAFTAVATLVWNDPRQAFDASTEGPERVFRVVSSSMSSHPAGTRSSCS
ncbi:MAG: hypothetical protein HC809_00325 [Gammaproteobacteria bacterium]|nr:hypothetical protein [Gammaproteobacteria bacterium]